MVSKHGFLHDRRFMILQVLEDGSLKNMHVAYFPEMVLFYTDITIPEDDNAGHGRITVTFRPPGAEEKHLDIPLTHDTAGLETIEVNMHRSPTKAYNMGAAYNDWLSSCFGYNVVLAYLGEHYRSVLMTADRKQQPADSWFSSITSRLPTAVSNVIAPHGKDEITFADCAPYLVVSETSMKDVSNRLPDGEEMDITKFRPNIIVSGAAEEWEEDYWAELMLGDAKLHCVQNCNRCQSINIDFATGKLGTGESGKMLKKLQSNRRVDPGAKYSPIFGRYAFLDAGSQGMMIAVGDEVEVTRRNAERTVFGEERQFFFFFLDMASS